MKYIKLVFKPDDKEIIPVCIINIVDRIWANMATKPEHIWPFQSISHISRIVMGNDLLYKSTLCECISVYAIWFKIQFNASPSANNMDAATSREKIRMFGPLSMHQWQWQLLFDERGRNDST
jgi:hypothetical protein